MIARAFLALVCLASANACAGTWSNLWLTPEQQAQRLLDSGKPAAAAKLFADPRRRAYAELESGQFAGAARRLAPFKDAASQYNRGNALARAGELQAALSAYDAALAKARPDSSVHRDAKHNRELVARQLKRRDRDAARHSRSSGGGQAQNSQSARRGNAGRSGGGGKPKSRPGQRADAQASNRGNQSKPNAAGGGQGARSSGAHNGQSSPREAKSQGAAKSEAEQARRDAAAALAERRSGASNAKPDHGQLGKAKKDAAGDDRNNAATSASNRRPESEQKLALDQWLRQIADDPGGLLRRKFLIEHLMKQQQGSS